MGNMPRAARASVGGMCYHVYNCGNNRAEVFHEPDDSDAFLATAVEGCERLPMRVLAYCVMPNHFHMVLWPRHAGDLSRWMQWLLTAHVRRVPPRSWRQRTCLDGAVQSLSDSGG